MDRCPKCGYKLKITDLKPECPGCGVNLMYYDMQLRLENDAIKAAEENAVMQAFARKIVKSVIGSVTVILRLVMAVLTVISLLVPFAKTVTAGAGMEAGKSVGLINIIVAIIKGNAFSDGFTVVTVLFLVVFVLCLASLLISPFLFSKKALVGQTAGRAIVIERPEDVERLDLTRDVRLFSQTTQPLEGFRRIVDYISAHIQPPATFRPFDTICRQVANRLPAIRAFAARHDVILFVCGLKSSNGRVLFEACRAVNPRSHLVDAPESICFDWFRDARSVGICGATSTPTWLMEACREAILR